MECFVKSLPFVSVVNMTDIDIYVKEEPFESKIQPLHEKKNLIIVDIHGDKGLEYAYVYRNNYTIIPDFNMVCHDFGIVKSKPILEKLILFYDLDLNNTNKYMIVLDSNRYRYNQENSVNEYNNQYEVSEEDLPEIEMLKFLNINDMAYICSEKIKEDIAPYLEYLKYNGIDVQVYYI